MRLFEHGELYRDEAANERLAESTPDLVYRGDESRAGEESGSLISGLSALTPGLVAKSLS
jgi:oxalate decarboxylase/phosphoglucose isomerase-like protein (cupin superfamily)